MYTAPDAVHLLLDMVTRSLIKFVRMQAGRAVNFFGYTHVNLWRPWGIYVSDDVAAVVSPGHYREFMKGPNERISRLSEGYQSIAAGDMNRTSWRSRAWRVS